MSIFKIKMNLCSQSCIKDKYGKPYKNVHKHARIHMHTCTHTYTFILKYLILIDYFD